MKLGLNKNFRKIIFGFIIFSFVFSALTINPSFVNALELQQSPDALIQQGAGFQFDSLNDSSSGLNSAQLQGIDTFGGLNFPSQDPTINNSSGPSFNINIGGAGGAIGSCIGELLASSLASVFQSGTVALTSTITLSVPVLDTNLAAKETGGAGQPGRDGIAYCLGNATIEMILAGTIEWVKSGFQGNPAFVDDPEQFFTDIADYELGNFLNDISGGFICSPWDINIRLAILDDYFSSYGGFRGCRLSEVVDNVDQFVQGDFKEGGWVGWFELTQNPGSNPYGTLRQLDNELYGRVQASQGRVTTELGWSGGFLSLTDGEGNTTTPGKMIQDSISKKLGLKEGRLTIADEFDELMGALVNQFMSIALDELGN